MATNSLVQQTFDWERFERLSVLELWTPDEIFEYATDELLAKFYEDQRIERKPAGFHAEAIAIYVCMWANTPPDGGVLVLGIEDDGTITGSSHVAAQQVDNERRVRSDLVRDAPFSSRRILVRTTDGRSDSLLLLRVPYRSDAVVRTNKGEAWIRRGSSKHLLTEDEIRELMIERGQLTFELEPCGLKWPDKFDLQAVRSWVSSVRKMKRIDNELTIEQVLANHRLGRTAKGEFIPNNSCALLFANDPQDVIPGCMIRFQRIEGQEAVSGRERNVVKDITLTGTVPNLITDAAKVLDTHLRTYSKLGADGKFYTAPEYPLDAWLEAVVNACVHRSYNLRNTHIFIRMFDDKLVVESPGGFPPLVTPENIYDVHHRRNWWLMDAMLYLDFVKCENEGAKRIRDSMQAMSLPPPEFEQKPIGGAIVRVTLRNNQNMRERWVDADICDIVGKDLAAKLTPFQTRTLNFAVEHKKINVTEAMQFMARPRWHVAKKELDQLCTLGLLEYRTRYERDSSAHYVPTMNEHPAT
jgi:ATP-dependent DNA helicase RecG